MPRVRDMQGVSANLEFVRTNDRRRNISHCIHHVGKKGARICTNTLSPIYNQRCNSSSHCDYYEDDRD